jgi:hypothetical protein
MSNCIVYINSILKSRASKVDLACNPSYSGSGDQENGSLRKPSLQDPILTNRKLGTVAGACHLS